MDDGKAAGSKLKWWSRPGRTPGTEPSAEAGPQAMPPADSAPGAARTEVSGMSGTSDVQQAGDWIVRPPERGDGSGVGVGAGEAGAAGAPVTPVTSGISGTFGMSGASDRQEAEDWTVRPPEQRNGSEVRTAPEASGTAATAGAAERAGAAEESAAVQGERAGGGADRAAAATVTLGQVPSGARDEAKADPRSEAPGGAAPTAPDAATAAASGPAPASPMASVSAETPSATPQRQQPLHPEDPYGTPPYGGPGPWAPAPPVQRPVATPAHGTVLPPAAGPMPPYGAPAPAAPGAPASQDTAPQTTGSPAPTPQAADPQAHTPQSGPPQPAAASGPVAAPHPAHEGTDGAGGAFVPHPGDGGPRPAGAATPYPAQQQQQQQPQLQPQPHPQAPPHTPRGAWQQYDPWSAPLQGGPVVPPPPGVRRSRRGMLVAGAVALALLAGGVGGGIGAYVERYGGINDIKLPQAAGDEGGRKPDSVAGIAQTALPGVVTLHVRGNAEQGTGTGFVLDRQGHILTNNHVVEPAGTGGEISVTFSGGQTAKAKVVGQDGGYDLAVVQVEGVSGLRPLTLGNSDSVQVGDPVVAIGAPYDLANTVTSGIISAKQRPITAGGEKGDGSDISYVDALQTDAPINPGNSGGPLVDAKARVIGINSAIRAADSGSGLDGGGQGGSIGLGFAIPINQAKRVAEELINTGRATHPVIGVTLEMEYAGDGARVSERSKDGKPPVTPGGPGAKAGIKAGDVITKVDGAPVHSGEELIVKIRSHRPGDTLMLTLQRGGKDQSVRLRLGSSSTG
ncbi:trypsin-like peptidase domain-containing protein [Streptomyces inhibens]|uniref:trypsin-like peptidase domain-containing protein n=1 Tax=Streptomyces inhibens TaxID=2293571 RepID=UPI001EE6E5C5|nr:trypsin-like peptidase domain-containing protein [Streptomyces inhibens]UKY52522.1 trypsin-like peptidase domain-containing protein [Streptomyces inhibens]